MTEQLHVAAVRLYRPRVVRVHAPTSVAAHATTKWSMCWAVSVRARARPGALAGYYHPFGCAHVLHASHIGLMSRMLHSGGLRMSKHGGAPVGGQA
jgi:hypothetical protein